jgi:hypothetical protein
MEGKVQTYKDRLVSKYYKQRQIGWLWWNFFVDNYVKIHKDFGWYSYILWLWDLTNRCQNYNLEWKSSRIFVYDTTWKF